MEEEIDRLLLAAESDSGEALRNASHVVTVRLADDWDTEVELRSSGDFHFSKFDFSYSQTCYKAQGSEYETVYVFTHKSHAVMLCNEFFYTASTRAKQHLVLICEPDHLLNAVKKQAIPGRDWRSKLNYFQSSKKKESLLPFENIVVWGAKLKMKMKAAASNTQ